MAKLTNNEISLIVQKLNPGQDKKSAIDRWHMHIDILIAEHADKLHDVHLNDWYFESEDGTPVKTLAAFHEDNLVVLRVPSQIKRYSKSLIHSIDLLKRHSSTLSGFVNWTLQQKSSGYFQASVSYAKPNTQGYAECVHIDPNVAILLAILKSLYVTLPDEPT